MNGDFSTKIKTKIENVIKKYSGSNNKIENYEDFKKQIDNKGKDILENTVSDIYQMTKGKQFNNEEEFKAWVWPSVSKHLETDNHQNISVFEEYSQLFRNAINENNDFRDVIKQEVRHDWYSKLRFLLFRTLTTIFIAGAAIGAAMFASHLGYDMVLIKEKPAKIVQAKPTTSLTKKDNYSPADGFYVHIDRKVCFRTIDYVGSSADMNKLCPEGFALLRKIRI
ncbi:MAG: hypothetical protein HRT54_16350 [Colwellia sp.]|nr:hypothetical protein [Colwellia sp.]